MGVKIEFSATLPNGETVTRTSGTMAYTHTVGGVTWHKSFAGALKQKSSNDYGPIVEVVATKVLGKVDIETREFYVNAQTDWSPAQRQAILDLIDVKLAPKPAKVKAPRHTKKTVAVATGQDILDMAVEAAEAEVEADDEAVTPAEVADVELPEPEVAPEAPAKKVTKKQALGAMVHAAALALLEGELPEGYTADEAEDVLRKWLQYIPTAANPGGWQPKA